MQKNTSPDTPYLLEFEKDPALEQHYVGTLFRQFLTMLEHEKGYSPHTIENYRRDLSNFLHFITKHLGEMPEIHQLSALTPNDFRSWLAQLARQEMAQTSIARHFSALRSWFKWMNRQNIIENTAIFSIRTPKLPHKLPRPVSIKDANSMLEIAEELHDDSWQGKRDLAVLTLLYGCGLRISEALSITYTQWSQLASINPLLTITGKGNKQRRIPLLPQVVQAVNDYLKLCPYSIEGEIPIFKGARGGVLSARQIQLATAKIRQLLNLPDSATPHALRHAFATHILANGGDLRSIQGLLGHASLTSTQRYTEIDTTHLMKSYNAAHPRAKAEKTDE